MKLPRDTAVWAEVMVDRQWFVLYVLVCLEVGVLLILVPWTSYWERNYFLEAYPALNSFVLEPAFRGAVSGLGVANIYVGLHEILWRRRRPAISEMKLFSGEISLDTNGKRANHNDSSDSSAQSETLLSREENS
jgi:hypothetical protein